ncbi:hypothetical protein HK405_014327 [Cladochytrium tenue]|nr:hypothetical protein HK405_014327 [Cladochytrium tenue]
MEFQNCLKQSPAHSAATSRNPSSASTSSNFSDCSYSGDFLSQATSSYGGMSSKTSCLDSMPDVGEDGDHNPGVNQRSDAVSMDQQHNQLENSCWICGQKNFSELRKSLVRSVLGHQSSLLTLDDAAIKMAEAVLNHLRKPYQENIRDAERQLKQKETAVPARDVDFTEMGAMHIGGEPATVSATWPVEARRNNPGNFIWQAFSHVLKTYQPYRLHKPEGLEVVRILAKLFRNDLASLVKADATKIHVNEREHQFANGASTQGIPTQESEAMAITGANNPLGMHPSTVEEVLNGVEEHNRTHSAVAAAHYDSSQLPMSEAPIGPSNLTIPTDAMETGLGNNASETDLKDDESVKSSLPAGWADKYGPSDWAERVKKDPPFAPWPELLYEPTGPPHDKLSAFNQNLGRDKDHSDADDTVLPYHSDTEAIGDKHAHRRGYDYPHSKKPIGDGADRTSLLGPASVRTPDFGPSSGSKSGRTHGATSVGYSGSRHAARGDITGLTDRSHWSSPSSATSVHVLRTSMQPLKSRLVGRRGEEGYGRSRWRRGHNLHPGDVRHISHQLSEMHLIGHRRAAAVGKGVNMRKSTFLFEREAEHLNFMLMNSVTRLSQVTSVAMAKVAQAVAAATAANNAATDKVNNDAAAYAALKELRSARLLEVEWAEMAGRAVATSVLDGLVSPVMLQQSVRNAARMYQHDGGRVPMVLKMFANHVASVVGQPEFAVDEILRLANEEMERMGDDEESDEIEVDEDDDKDDDKDDNDDDDDDDDEGEDLMVLDIKEEGGEANEER